MLYRAYQTYSDLMIPLRAFSRLAGVMVDSYVAKHTKGVLARNFASGLGLLADTKLSHRRLPFGIKSVMVGNREAPVEEVPALRTPFGTLLHFKKDVATPQPRVLVVAPLSGHFATLLRGTVSTLLPENDVYITDWHNARDVKMSAGRFGFDTYIEHVIKFIEALGPGTHVVAVCQPCVQVLAAVAVMAEAGNPAQPRSMTLMAGPIDARLNPTEVNALATGNSLGWFERNLIATVPLRYAGAGRRVYPGFLQLMAFMSMNIDRHVKAHFTLLENLVNGEYEKAKSSRDFYDEYFAVLDMPAEFYLETVRLVFQEFALARGALEYQGRRVDPSAIRRTALLTVEGEKDDICAVGQTMAAQDLCKRLPPYKKRHHLQPGVGHYGVFSGSRWTNQIYPILRNVILANESG